jgi:hypothetical protein
MGKATAVAVPLQRSGGALQDRLAAPGAPSATQRSSQAEYYAGLRLGLIFLGELHAWGRRVCPGELGRP